MDNAGNNDTFTEELETRSIELGFRFTSNNRIRCFAHVLNIVVQDLLKYLKSEAKHENEYDSTLADPNDSTEASTIATMDISIGLAVAKVRINFSN